MRVVVLETVGVEVEIGAAAAFVPPTGVLGAVALETGGVAGAKLIGADTVEAFVARRHIIAEHEAVGAGWQQGQGRRTGGGADGGADGWAGGWADGRAG